MVAGWRSSSICAEPQARHAGVVDLVTVRILGWKSEIGWTDWSGQQRAGLTRRLGKLLNLGRVEVKRVARHILNRECDVVRLPKASDRLAAEPLRHILEALGAKVIVEEA